MNKIPSKSAKVPATKLLRRAGSKTTRAPQGLRQTQAGKLTRGGGRQPASVKGNVKNIPNLGNNRSFSFGGKKIYG